MTSISGLAGNVGQVNYSASKAAILGFTKSLAKEVARKGITVNAIAPGVIETEMTASSVPDEVRKHIPAGRLGTPGEVASLVGFLASEEAAYITGQVININGGLL